MKRLAILNYMFLFDPAETGFTGSSQFESYFADFCAANGIDANVVETAGSGVKAIYLSKIEILTTASNSQPSKTPLPNVPQQVKKVQQQTPPSNFKQFSSRGVPYNLQREKKVPDLTFQQGRSNRQKVRGV